MRPLFLLLLATTAHAELLTFAWDANSEPDVIGYRLHFGSESGDYGRAVNCGNVTQFSLELEEGERFVVVTAYNAAGLESPPSNELDLQGDPPAPPEGFHAKPSADGMQVSAHFPGRGVVVEESDDLKTWRELAEGFGWVVAAVEQNKRGFFRYSLN